jgi:hypothetical protein
MSAPPIPYSRQATFTQFSTEQFPTTGQELEAEFNKVAQSIDTTQARLAEIQRDDGKLRNLSVHIDAIDRQVIDLLGGATGYFPPVPFSDGLVVNSHRFTVLRTDPISGKTYAYAPAIDVPFTTTGIFEPSQWRLVQGVAAGDLQSAGEDAGAYLVGFDDQLAKSPAFLRTVSDALNGVPVGVGRFIPRNLIPKIVDKTITEDLSPYFNDIINEFRDRGQGTILMIDGLYPVSNTIVGCPNLALTAVAAANRTSSGVSGVEMRLMNSLIGSGGAFLDFDSCPGSSLYGITLNGVDRSSGVYGISCDTHSLNLSQVLIREFNRGISGPVSSSTMVAVKITRCVVGVRNSVDTRWIGCHIIGCDSFGWQFQAGSNDNHLIGCKSDWNGDGVYTTTASNLVIVGCVFDRNNRYGIRIGGGTNISIGPNVYRRNGRGGLGANESGHICIENGASNFSIVGGTTRTGADDDGTGLVSPESGIILGNCSVGTITGFDASGVVGEPINRIGGTTQTDVNIINCQPSAQTNTVILGGSSSAVRSSTSNVSNGATGNFTVANAAAGANSVQVRKLRIAARNTGTNAVSLADMDLVVRRGSTGGATVVSGSLNSLLGSAFSSMSVSVAAGDDTASTLVVSVTNNAGAQHQITVAMTN